MWRSVWGRDLEQRSGLVLPRGRRGSRGAWCYSDEKKVQGLRVWMTAQGQLGVTLLFSIQSEHCQFEGC